ncbi:AraC family transcriptional regulator ligand-binding domain-containing protein [Parashewanella tropica]|uniref:AraC family transcriptional regulator ligand-binding domain-containing protein n=1 Tax=Parashewanella tropica TaxID=2547970 RepID=UPI0010599AD7|nr:AraC family transcriptional regulator ligand-binding domain-containing protein [Parashewanella tropica]
MLTPAFYRDKSLRCQPFVLSLVALFKQRGLTADKLLKGTGIFLADFRQTEKLLSPQQFNQLIHNAKKLWKGDDLPFLLGQFWLAEQSQELASGLISANDATQAFSFWHQFKWLTHPWLQLSFLETEDYWHIIFSLDNGGHQHQVFLYENLFANLQSVYKQMTKKQLIAQYSFPYAQPQQLAYYHKYFGQNLEFSAPVCRMSICKTEIQPLQSQANHYSSKRLIHRGTYKSLKLQPYRIGLEGFIRKRLKSKKISLDEMAKQLNLSPASLKRRLKECQTSYQVLQDEAQLINALIALSKLEPNDVAKKMDYQDSSNFRRSFKRWTGALPQSYRLWLA